MKAVILAAGRGVRMKPLTDTIPKTLLRVNGRALFDYSIDLLPADISEVIVLVSYLAEQIIAYATAQYPNVRFRFITQPSLGGTAQAMQLAAPHLRGEKFLVIYADDIHSKAAVARCAQFDLAVLVEETDHPERFGIINVTPDALLQTWGALGRMIKFVEKPKQPESNLAWVGVAVLDDRVFQYAPVQHTNGEYYLTDMIDQLSRDAAIAVVKTDLWLPIGYPNDLQSAETTLKIVNSKFEASNSKQY